jgi:Amino acid permease
MTFVDSTFLHIWHRMIQVSPTRNSFNNVSPFSYQGERCDVIRELEDQRCQGENLGVLPGLVAAAALMIDYILNVAVSVAAGVLNLASLFPILSPYIVFLDVALVLLMMILNLRGVRESGAIFALPTYFFVVSALLLIVVGLFKALVIHHQPIIGTYAYVPAIEPLSVFLILRAFATGCSAMTGVEAISNGVPAFQKPETRNASITLTWMAVILGTLFLGITLLATTYAVEPNPAGNPTVIAQIAALVVSFSKFLEGAWIVIVLIPILVLLFRAIHRHYQHVARERVADIPIHPKDIHHRFIVPIAGLDRASIQSLAYARSLSSHVTAVHIATNEDEIKHMQAAWDTWQQQVPEEEDFQLLVIESPYRSLIRPMLAYIDTIRERHPDDTLTLVLPEFLVAHWWEYILHNQTAFRLKAALLFRPGIVVTDVPQHLRARHLKEKL